MDRPYRHLEYTEQEGVFCVRVQNHLTEDGLEQLSTEMARLVDEAGCRRMVVCLGPGDYECLYSLFLANLISLQRRLEAVGGALVLAELTDNTQGVFRATGLERHFKFFDNQAAAVQALCIHSRA